MRLALLAPENTDSSGRRRQVKEVGIHVFVGPSAVCTVH